MSPKMQWTQVFVESSTCFFRETMFFFRENLTDAETGCIYYSWAFVCPIVLRVCCLDFWPSGQFFEKFSRKFQGKIKNFVKSSQIFTFFPKNEAHSPRSFYAVYMRFVCGFQTAYKLYAVFMRFEANCIQFGPNCIQFLCSLYAVWKPHTNRI